MPDSQTKPTPIDTRERILDTAAELFAREGLSRPTVRQITTGAGVNVAAVNYHFGSREALIDAVFARYAKTVNGERLRRLDQILAASGENRPELPAILEAYLEAPLLHLDARQSGAPPRLAQPLLQRHFGPITQRFLHAIGRALPELPRTELEFRFRLVMAALAATAAQNQSIQSILKTETKPMEYEQKIKRLVAFLAGGLCAPAQVEH
jgi:AcrR family transcriptional regulator